MLNEAQICQLEERARWDLLRAAKLRELNLTDQGINSPEATETTRRAAFDFQMAAVAATRAQAPGKNTLPPSLILIQGGA